jgi:hypothetical protein
MVTAEQGKPGCYNRNVWSTAIITRLSAALWRKSVNNAYSGSLPLPSSLRGPPSDIRVHFHDLVATVQFQDRKNTCSVGRRLFFINCLRNSPQFIEHERFIKIIQPQNPILSQLNYDHIIFHEDLFPYCHVYVCDYTRGLDWWLDLLTTYRSLTTSNYSAIANQHTLRITRAHAKFSRSAFTSRFLVTDLNNFLCSCPHCPANISQLTPRLAATSHQPPTLLIDRTQLTAAESESYVTTDGQSASLSWNKAPIWGLRPDIYYCQTVAGLLVWGALSDERTRDFLLLMRLLWVWVLHYDRGSAGQSVLE